MGKNFDECVKHWRGYKVARKERTRRLRFEDYEKAEDHAVVESYDKREDAQKYMKLLIKRILDNAGDDEK